MTTGQQTTVSVQGSQILLNGQPTTLLGFRVASAPLRDDWTEELIAQLDTWKAHGVNCLIVWLQGSSGGYTRLFTDQGALNPAKADVLATVGFAVHEVTTRNGSTTGPEVIERTRCLIRAADERGIVVIVGLFYRAAWRGCTNPATLINASRTAVTPFGDCRNVIFNVFNEATSSHPLEARENLRAYMRAVKQAAPNSLVGTGSVRSEVTAGLLDLPELDIVMQDSGWDERESVLAFCMLSGLTAKPIMNIESFNGSGSGFLDDPTRQLRAPDGYYIDFPDWRRIYGAWKTEDFWSESGRFIAGKQSYLRLINSVVRDPEKRTHLLIHVAGWFQGASRVENPRQLGDVGAPDQWNNTFSIGYGMADGTSENPGIRWILEGIKKNDGA